MKHFSLKQAVEIALGEKRGIPVLEINILGCGGAFDLNEKNSSMLLKTVNETNILIDCGYTSYATLKINEVIGDIDFVFITHTHDDHISGLSSFIYDRWFLHNKKTVIHCTKKVSDLLKKYLFEICNHEKEQIEFCEDEFVFLEKDNISITKIDTTNYHFPSFPNSGFLFHFKIEDDKSLDLIYSGDINVPIFNLLDKEQYKFLYDNLDNCFVFHDMTALEYSGNPHCYFKMLVDIKNDVNKMITYHHSIKHIEFINLQEDFKEIASTSALLMDKKMIIIKDFSL